MAEKYFGDMNNHYPRQVPSVDNCRFTGSEFRYRDDNMPFTYAAIAVEGVGWDHPDNIPLMIANTLIGQWDRTHGSGINAPSRLAQRVGFGGEVQSFQSFNTCYKDTGLWGIYMVCDVMSVRDLIWNVQEEWKYLCTSVTDEDVDRGRNLLKTNMLLQLDGTTPICEDIGRQLLSYGRRIPLHELEARLNAVDASVLKDAMMRNLYHRDIACSVVGRTEGWDDYNKMRSRMSWWRL